MRGELRALKQHILQLEVEAGGVRHTALRREFNAKLSSQSRATARLPHLSGGGGREITLTTQNDKFEYSPGLYLATDEMGNIRNSTQVADDNMYKAIRLVMR